MGSYVKLDLKSSVWLNTGLLFDNPQNTEITKGWITGMTATIETQLTGEKTLSTAEQPQPPKVFISYSWETHKEDVIELATKLRHNGVNVIIDVWDLNPGHDEYAFMEQSVTDPEVKKVIIICDRSYAEKADKRKGGVGAETRLITPEIYGKVKQEKFIPVIWELDDKNNPFMPAYLKSTVYIDMTERNYENGYDELLRNIYDKPARKKPELGSIPEFKEEKASLFSVKEAIRKFKYTQNETTAKIFLFSYLESLKDFYKEKQTNPNDFLTDFRSMKDHRDYFLEFITLICENKKFAPGKFFATAFETLYNKILDLKFFKPNASSCYDNSFYIFKLHLRELFLYTLTYLLHHEMFSDIHNVLFHTYFLRRSFMSNAEFEAGYVAFLFDCYPIDNWLRKIPEFSQRLTPTGHLICCEREKLPVYTQKAIAQTDLFLFQVRDMFSLPTNKPWTPWCYIYTEREVSMWQKLKSKEFCEKVFKLFDIHSIDELRRLVERSGTKPAYVYDHCLELAPSITAYIKVNEIGIFP